QTTPSYSLLSRHLTLSFFYTDPAPSHIYTLSLHDALPISSPQYLDDILDVVTDMAAKVMEAAACSIYLLDEEGQQLELRSTRPRDRKSTRLNSSHVKISYAVFCLKKKTRSRVKTL